MFWLPVGLAFVVWVFGTAGLIFWDARRWMGGRRALGLAIAGLVRPRGYWWGQRLGFLPQEVWERVLAKELARMRLTSPDGVHCPLCGREMPGVLRVDARGEVAAQRPSVCRVCGFRLDACRHCAHFEPAHSSLGAVPGAEGWGGEPDYTTGSCRVYREWRPVTEVCSPSVAREMLKRGWEGIMAGRRVADSYVPFDECTRFQLDLRRLRRNGVRELTLRHQGLLAAWSQRAGKGDLAGRPYSPTQVGDAG
ncbi:MAG: hypothetical protein ACUVXG_09265 [Anaerolineae bacterium]